MKTNTLLRNVLNGLQMLLTEIFWVVLGVFILTLAVKLTHQHVPQFTIVAIAMLLNDNHRNKIRIRELEARLIRNKVIKDETATTP